MKSKIYFTGNNIEFSGFYFNRVCGPASAELRGNGYIFQNNIIADTQQCGSSDADAIDFFGDSGTIRNNTIILHIPDDVQTSNPPHQDCFQTWGPDSARKAATNTIIEGNSCWKEYINNDPGQGMILEGSWQNIVVRDNLFTAYRALNIFNGNKFTVLNNTFVGYSQSTNSHAYLGNVPNATIQYNIFYNVYRALNVTGSLPNGGYNVMYRADGKSVQSYSNYPKQSTDLWGINPKFVDPANEDYHLQANSPACGYGAFPCGNTTPTPSSP